MQRYDWWSRGQRPTRDRSLDDADLWREGYAPREPLWWGNRFDPRYEGFERARGYDRLRSYPSTRRGYEPAYGAPGRQWAPERQNLGTDDEALRRAIEWRFAEDPALDSSRIRIQVRDGVVTLSGTVRDYLDARYAWDDAWETTGIRGVISQLDVEHLSDEESSARTSSSR